MPLTISGTVLAKVESVYGTDPTPVEATNAILVENLQIAFANTRMYERNANKATLGRVQKLYGGALLQVSFDVEVKGSGAAGTAPELGVLLRGCRMDETIVVSTSVTYAPVSSGAESITLYVFEGGILKWIVVGCRGNFTADLTVGQPGKFSFTFLGHFTKPADIALPSPTYNATVPEVLLGLSFTIDSYAAPISALSFDMGNETVPPADITEADGYGEIQNVRATLSGSMDPLAGTVAAYDWVNKWQTDAEGALTTGAVGATAGNIYTITMPAVSYDEPSPADREGFVSREIAFQGSESAGDDEISIAFT